uniref:Ceramide synthase 3 n=1 Tax=Terrapene triunguis TaxID=2587831 RepID=A0A674IG51_9SAUR
ALFAELGPRSLFWFWWETLWIPANCTWADLEDHDGIVFPKPYQLYATIPYAFVMLMVRFLIERYIAIPLAKALGIKNVTRVKPQPNAVLENYFRKCTKHPSQSEIQGLAKKCNWTVRLVEKWFRRRRNLEADKMVLFICLVPGIPKPILFGIAQLFLLSWQLMKEPS